MHEDRLEGDVRHSVVSETAKRVVRTVTESLGDGCVCRMLAPGDALETVAAAHRDPRGRAALDAAAARGPARIEGWADQALTRSLTLSLLGDPAMELVGPVDWPVASAVAIPVLADGRAEGLVVAFRDATSHAFTGRDERRIARLVQEAFVPGEAVEPPAFVESERLLDHVEAGIWMTDRDGVTTYVNDAMCHLLGVPASAIVGQAMTDFLDEEPDTVRGRQGELPERRDHRLHRPDGVDAWVSATSTRMTAADGRPTGTVTTMTDVTRRKAAEVELRMRVAAHEAVAELSAWAVQGEPVATLVHGAAVATADLLGVEHVAIVELNDDGDEMIPRAVVGWDPDLIASSRSLPVDSPAFTALGDREPLVVNDLERRDWAPNGVDPEGLRSGVYVDIGDGRGYIAAHGRDRHAFRGRDLSFLIPLAELLARRWREQPRDLLPAPA